MIGSLIFFRHVENGRVVRILRSVEDPGHLRVQGMVNKGKMPGHCVIGAVVGFSCPMGEGSNDHFAFRSRCIPGSMPCYPGINIHNT